MVLWELTKNPRPAYQPLVLDSTPHERNLEMTITASGRRRARPGEAIQFLETLPLDKNNCINWPYARMPEGYGQIGYQGRPHNAHHVAARLHIPNPENLPCVLHKPETCHNRLCVNPRHLRWGDQAENAADRNIDGTHNKGERNGGVKLTIRQVTEIWAYKGGDLPQRQIAARYGISQKQVSRIWNGQQWSHVTNELNSGLSR